MLQFIIFHDLGGTELAVNSQFLIMGPIHTAAQGNQDSVVKSLVAENRKLIDQPDENGRTPLHWAATTDAGDIVNYLISQGADVDKQDPDGWTALHTAVSAGNDAIVRALVAAGADVNRRNDKGLTPLHYAASKTRIEIGKFLIERGANINARDNANQLPLHRAATTGSTGFIELLLQEKSQTARLNVADRVGNTPLHLAIESAHAQAAVMLIEAGANREKVNLEGKAPEDVDGVMGEEQRRIRQFIKHSCDPSG